MENVTVNRVANAQHLQRSAALRPVSATAAGGTNRTDAELMLAIRGGDREAMAELFERHQERLFRFALAGLRDREAARDAVAEVMLTVWQSPGSFRGASQVSTWLHGIAWNKLRDQFRRRRRSGVQEQLHEGNEGIVALDEEGPSAMQRRRLRRCFGKLSPEQRQALHLAYYGERPVREIAVIIGAPEGTVKSRAHYALRLLRQCVEQDGGVA